MNKTDFHLTYAGTISLNNSHAILWNVLRELNIGLRIIGTIHPSVIKELEGVHIQYDGFINHAESIQIIKKAYLLLLLMNQPSEEMNSEVVPGKIWEYIATRRPIIGIGNPCGDMALILRKLGSGLMIDPDNYDEIKRFILSCKNWMD